MPFYPPIITVELPVKTNPSLGAMSPNTSLIYSAEIPAASRSPSTFALTFKTPKISVVASPPALPTPALAPSSP